MDQFIPIARGRVFADGAKISLASQKMLSRVFLYRSVRFAENDLSSFSAPARLLGCPTLCPTGGSAHRAETGGYRSLVTGASSGDTGSHLWRCALGRDHSLRRQEPRRVGNE